MKTRTHHWVARAATYIGFAAAFIFLGQILSFWWLLITGAVSIGVWMMIWLWPERVEPISNRR